VFLVAYFVLKLHFWFPDEDNHQAHALEVFNCTAHKVVNDAISYACIQTNNTYCKEVLDLEINKKLSSSSIYWAVTSVG
jgi:hypothetical protein